MWKVKYDEDESQYACYYGLVRFYWYSCELAHMQKDALNLLVDMGFDVDLERIVT